MSPLEKCARALAAHVHQDYDEFGEDGKDWFCAQARAVLLAAQQSDYDTDGVIDVARRDVEHVRMSMIDNARGEYVKVDKGEVCLMAFNSGIKAILREPSA